MVVVIKRLSIVKLLTIGVIVMSNRSFGWLLVLSVIGLFFFAEEIFSVFGMALGSVIELSVTLLISLFFVGLVFFVVVTVFGSVLLGAGAAFIALILSGIGFFWPLILCVLVLYFIFRKSKVSRTG
ncbi:hypothetical protein [Idiomarina sp. UBA1919]|jgi:Na+-driven multidrug efflux pump|uniref:hypothetical protein n=2 Tax=Idiomarina TaxID=135575 RepID=UPI00257B939F|nr:hypothetical protein [Idiomarina sp. UBA1919]|tara:strand:- start:6213 stop:6590 length:378 start_codon:yes stop_codon:yes gene_type:complete